MTRRDVWICAGMILLLGQGPVRAAGDGDPNAPFWAQWPVEIHGFTELRGGYRLQNDSYEKDMSIMEARLQTGLSYYPDWGEVVVKADAYGDGVTERGEFDLREANVLARPLSFMDLKIGRQIMTWGTGDLIFINDMFPKDWQSFFIGRETSYLKAPSDAVKASLFFDWVDVDLMYTPQFDSDRYIEGEYISYWNPVLGRTAGRDMPIRTSKPGDWFSDDELALRLYKTVKGYELALYGYWGFWKSPAGMNAALTQGLFPALDVYGASAQGTLGAGIANLEIGYYDSRDDAQGTNPLVNNSEFRYLAGYTREIAHELNAGVQYYVEQLLDYPEYRASLPPGMMARDRYRHVITGRLTKLLMNQNLTCSVFGYYSPSDLDTYIRPNLKYKASDAMALEVGANIFAGSAPHTFFGQFEDNTNLYTAVRYSF